MFETLQYYFRFDEDLRPYAYMNATIVPLVADPFLDMKARGLRFVTPQCGLPSLENDNSISDATEEYLKNGGFGGPASDMWVRAQSFYPRYGKQVSHPSRYHSVAFRLATSVCRLRHYQMQQGPTEPHAGRNTFLLSSGGAGRWVLLSGL